MQFTMSLGKILQMFHRNNPNRGGLSKIDSIKRDQSPVFLKFIKGLLENVEKTI